MGDMPYIITTQEPDRWLGSQPYGSPGESYLPARMTRQAVATRPQAIREIIRIEREHDPGRTYGPGAHGWPSPPGTFGPLPDGTVIEVASAEWDDLMRAARMALTGTYRTAEILDAFNAKTIA